MNTLSVTRLQKNTTLRGDAHTHTHQNVKILILKKIPSKINFSPPNNIISN